MDYVTPKDKAAEWGISQRRVEILCESGRILGAYRLGRVWAIPKQAMSVDLSSLKIVLSHT